MNVELLESILKDELSAKKDGERYLLPEASRVTVLMQATADIVPVPKVTEIHIKSTHITLVTEDGQFFAEREAVFAIKSEGGAARSDKRPGFH